MASLSDNISNILQLQDVELTNAIATLRSQPGALDNYLNARRQDLLKTVTNEHSDTFAKVYGDLQRSSDNTNNILFYHIRNMDLNETQKKWLDYTKDQATGMRYTAQTQKRQFEINDWNANNKLDTLFFMQLLFITLTIVAPLLYVYRQGMIPSTVYYGITTILGLAVVLTLLIRYQYTYRSRNKHYWNRRIFSPEAAANPDTKCQTLEELMEEAKTGVVGNTVSGLENVGSTVDTASSMLTRLQNASQGK